MNVKINDIVRFLNDVGGGRVARIDGKTIYVEDEDGFERPVLERELVVVGQAGTKASAYERPLDIRARQVEPDKPAPKAQPAPEPVLPVEETPEGEVLNVVLGYEAREIKHLNTTTFYASLVNDSNYYLYFTYMTRGDETSEWQVDLLNGRTKVKTIHGIDIKPLFMHRDCLYVIQDVARRLIDEL